MTTMTTKRVAALQRALSSRNALAAVRELIANDGENEQQVVVYAYACILETSSAGLSILVDRFDDMELRKIDVALESIGASRTRADLRTITTARHQALEAGTDRQDISEALEEQPEIRKLDEQYLDHVDEMEQRLIAFCAFCQRNVNELASG